MPHLPTNNPKHDAGSKKVSLHLCPPVALVEMAHVLEHGAAKYDKWNWRKSGVVRRIYLDAALRHLMAMIDGQTLDPESGRTHAGHVMACMAIMLDAASLGKLEDDEETVGAVADFLGGTQKWDNKPVPVQFSECDRPAMPPPQTAVDPVGRTLRDLAGQGCLPGWLPDRSPVG